LLAAADGSADVQLTTGEWPRLSADGRYLVFHRGNSTFSRADVWVRDLTTGIETKVFSIRIMSSAMTGRGRLEDRV